MNDQNEAPAECPECGSPNLTIDVTGPDAEDIRFGCGCPVPIEVAREMMSGAPFDDVSRGDDS